MYEMYSIKDMCNSVWQFKLFKSSYYCWGVCHFLLQWDQQWEYKQARVCLQCIDTHSRFNLTDSEHNSHEKERKKNLHAYISKIQNA